jgi:hypothetical protein
VPAPAKTAQAGSAGKVWALNPMLVGSPKAYGGTVGDIVKLRGVPKACYTNHASKDGKIAGTKTSLTGGVGHVGPG